MVGKASNGILQVQQFQSGPNCRKRQGENKRRCRKAGLIILADFRPPASSQSPSSKWILRQRPAAPDSLIAENGRENRRQEGSRGLSRCLSYRQSGTSRGPSPIRACPGNTRQGIAIKRVASPFS
jgi:hypothetical protein